MAPPAIAEKVVNGWVQIDRQHGDGSEVFPWFHRRGSDGVHIAQVRDANSDGRYWAVHESYVLRADESLEPVGKFVRDLGHHNTPEAAVEALRAYVNSKESLHG